MAQEYSVLLEASRGLLLAFSALYFYQCFLNVQMRSIQPVDKEERKNRSLFSFFCGVFCLSEYAITYCGGYGRITMLSLALIYFFVFISTYFYLQSMKEYYIGGRKLKKSVEALLILTFIGHTGLSIWQIFFDPSFPYFAWEEGNVSNPIVLASYGGKFFSPTPLFTLMNVMYGVSLFSILFAMLAGYIKGKYRDKIIVIGVALSILTVTYDMVTSTFLPEIFFYVAFAGNFPEVARVTFLAQKRITLRLGLETEKNEKLVAIKQQAIEKARFRSVANLANGIAHEVNNPLTIISSSAMLLKRAAASKKLTEDLIIKLSSDIQKTVERIAQIVKALRVISQSDSELEMAKYPVHDIVDDVTSHSFQRFSASGVKLETEFREADSREGAGMTIRCDIVKLSQAMIHLLENAFEAAKTSPEKWIKIVVSENESESWIKIMDSGIAQIPEDVQDKMFDPFYTSKEVGQGMGLGLPTAKSLIEEQGGVIEFSRSFGHTAFLVKLPKSN